MGYRETYGKLHENDRVIIDRAVSYCFEDSHYLTETEVLDRIGKLIDRRGGDMYLAIIDELSNR